MVREVLQRISDTYITLINVVFFFLTEHESRTKLLLDLKETLKRHLERFLELLG